MDLVNLDRQLPLRAYPPEKLNRTLLMDFTPWLSSLLSLTGETALNRLEIALPAVKDLCIGMGFHEIKRMFEQYVDGRLGIEPIPNYFDRILLGKIVAAYKSQNKPKPKKMEEYNYTDEEKEFILIEAVDRAKKEYKHTGDISEPYTHIYDYLYQQGQLPKHTKEFRDRITAEAKEIAKEMVTYEANQDYDLYRHLKTTLAKIEDGSHGRLKSIAKKLVLIEYFKQNDN